MIGNSHINRTYKFPPSNITIPTDDESLAFGKHRVETLCQSCHGTDLSGSVLIDDPKLGIVESANLTSGEGGIEREFSSDEDYVNAIRHGINPEGKPIYMPAIHSTSKLSDKDLGSIIAYLKTIPPLDKTTRGFQVTPLAKILLGAGMLPPFPVELVSHEAHIKPLNVM